MMKSWNKIFGWQSQMTAADRSTVVSAHQRIDELMIAMREHLAVCSAESRSQNARLKRLETLVISSGAATIILLISLLVR
jgi:hypothetical protein